MLKESDLAYTLLLNIFSLSHLLYTTCTHSFSLLILYSPFEELLAEGAIGMNEAL